MAKRSPSRASAAPAARPRMTDDQLRAKGFVPFLRPEHCQDGEWFQLTGFNALHMPGTEREQITCEVENENGNQFTLGVRQGSPDHRILHHAFGKDWRGWAGSVQVTIADGRRRDANNNKVQFVNVKAADTRPPVWSADEPPPHGDDDQ